MSYKNFVKEVQDFPIKGVNFKDISPLLSDQQMFLSAIVDMGKRVRLPDYWVGIDSRGYLFASALAIKYGGGVVCARKEGKTPGGFVTESYDLEYGKATLELQLGKGEVIIVDDVLATGGTLNATNRLAEKAGYDVVGNLVLIDLKYVPRVDDFNLNVKSIISYE